MFKCDKCKSKNLELIKRETKQKWDLYYMEMESFEVLTFKCKDCGSETIKCPNISKILSIKSTLLSYK